MSVLADYMYAIFVTESSICRSVVLLSELSFHHVYMQCTSIFLSINCKQAHEKKIGFSKFHLTYIEMSEHCIYPEP